MDNTIEKENEFLKAEIASKQIGDLVIAEDEKNISKITNEILKLQFCIILYSKILQRYFASHFETDNLKRTHFATESGLEEVLKNIDIDKLKNIKKKYSSQILTCLVRMDFKNRGENLAKDILKYIELNPNYDINGTSVLSNINNASNLELEHIYPRTKNKNNKFYECSDSYLGYLGNLSLLEKSINSNVSNKDYDSKVKEYCKSKVAMVRQIYSSNMEWNEHDRNIWTDLKIRIRGEYLAKKFIKF
ncbi:HNH endonuclease family protein [Lactobacillus taiwanensis]|uniref:HNH endonuclease family protein n=1 Tax=Lactobacillus taiwanensis TaxID=508451 RepID=UPI00242DE058|nr:HNH endonuclease family protein [Lactobacillus taiwanensis]